MATALRLLCNSLRPIEGSDLDVTLAGYLMALEGCPAWAIANAARRFLQGKVSGQSMVFCPRPPELRVAVDRELAPVHREIEGEARRMRLHAEAARYPDIPPQTDEARARVAAAYTAYCRGHTAMLARAGGGVDAPVLDPDLVAMTPDAPTTWERMGWLERGGGDDGRCQ